jgi:hypothetical protein
VSKDYVGTRVARKRDGATGKVVKQALAVSPFSRPGVYGTTVVTVRLDDDALNARAGGDQVGDLGWLKSYLQTGGEMTSKVTERTPGRVTAKGGLGFDIALTAMASTERVLWIDGNSYVSDGADTWSINGIGEVRWKVERWNKEYRATREYFGLPVNT